MVIPISDKVEFKRGRALVNRTRRDIYTDKRYNHSIYK